MNLGTSVEKSSETEQSLPWFCLRSQPKHEHIAAAYLKKTEGVEVFLPRIRFKRATRKGTACVTEALFPGYLFVRFDWQASVRRVQATPGTCGIVHFGDQWPVIPGGVIEELRRAVGALEMLTIAPSFLPGDAIQIAGGTLKGLHAVISQVLPGRERVAILMEFLGRQTTIELETSEIVREGDQRTAIVFGDT